MLGINGGQRQTNRNYRYTKPILDCQFAIMKRTSRLVDNSDLSGVHYRYYDERVVLALVASRMT